MFPSLATSIHAEVRIKRIVLKEKEDKRKRQGHLAAAVEDYIYFKEELEV